MRRGIFMLICTLTLSFLLCGCGNGDDVYFIKNDISMDKDVTSDLDETSMIVKCMYKGDHPEISINSVNGDNTKALIASCEFIIDPSYKKVEYKNYKFGEIYVTMDISALDGGDMVKIESIDFNINGENKCCVFESPLCIDAIEETQSSFELVNSVIVTHFDEEYDSSWETNADVTVEDVTFSENISMDNLKVYKATGHTQEEVDNKKEVNFPVKLKKGEVLILYGVIDKSNYLNYQYVYGSLDILYKFDDNNNTGEAVQGITVLGGNDGDDMEDVTMQKNLEYIVDNNLFE